MLKYILSALLSLSLAAPALAQSQAANGAIEGTISDSSGGVLPGEMRLIIAEVYSELLVLRALNVHFVGRILAGEKVGSEASILKQCWSHFHQHATSAIVDNATTASPMLKGSLALTP